MVELYGAKVILRDKRIEDAEFDYRWRSDPEIAKLDAAFPLSMSYERYLRLFQDQLRYPTPGSHHFGADAADGTYIGNCMYYDLDSISKEAELGIVIGDRNYWSNAYGYDAVTTLLDHMFSDLHLNRVLSPHPGLERAGPALFREVRIQAGAHRQANVTRLHTDGSACGRNGWIPAKSVWPPGSGAWSPAAPDSTASRHQPHRTLRTAPPPLSRRNPAAAPSFPAPARISRQGNHKGCPYGTLRCRDAPCGRPCRRNHHRIDCPSIQTFRSTRLP